MSECLLVIVSERISEWIDKGEVVDRYYNPGNRFDEVHLLLTNDDRPDPVVVQRLVGSARVSIHNLPARPNLLARKLGLWPILLRRWAAEAVPLARAISPNVVRCYGLHLNGLCALEIRRTLGTPVVVSLHDPRHSEESAAMRSVRRKIVRGAQIVIAVYRPLVPYLEGLGARRIEVVYNVLNANTFRAKQDYGVHDPVSVVSVGRQVPDKDPTPLIRAIAGRPGFRLTLVGDGPLHQDLCTLVTGLGVGDRITLHRALPNDELVATLPDHDLFAAYFEYLEAPKTVLEAMLCGLPVVVNCGPNGAVPELNETVCLLVDGDVDGYGTGFDALVADPALRARLGEAARAWAYRSLDPEQTERQVVALYDELLHGDVDTLDPP